jgi:hypothetical protein
MEMDNKLVYIAQKQLDENITSGMQEFSGITS